MLNWRKPLPVAFLWLLDRVRYVLSSHHFLALVILRLEILLKIQCLMRGRRGGLETDQSSGFQQQHRGCLLGKNEALF